MSQSVLRVCLRVCRGCVSECVVAVSQSVLWLCLRVCCGYVSECVAAVSQSVQPDGMVPTAPWRVEGAGATARVAMTAELSLIHI